MVIDTHFKWQEVEVMESLIAGLTIVVLRDMCSRLGY